MTNDTLSNFEAKRIAENFFKEKGIFSVDNITSLMSRAYEVGYEKGKTDEKIRASVSNIKTLSPSDLKFDVSSGLEYYKTPIQSINAASLDEMLKKSQM